MIARYTVGADVDHADRDSERIVLTIDKPYPNHNGGQLAVVQPAASFGDDARGELYIADYVSGVHEVVPAPH